MIRYVVFTQEELDAIKSGDDVKSIDQEGRLVIYINKEKYENMLISAKEKEFTDD